MLLPYRVKNPPDHFPFATVSLIAINTLVFALTSEAFLTVRRDVVDAYAVSHETLSLLRLITSMFLHGSLLHLAGNMLFLWLFGASVEGRLRPLKFLALYLLTGIAGSLLSDLVMGVVNPEIHSLGASGAIMGLAGAYLYMFPYSTICVCWFYYFRGGVTEWQARWVILMYGGLDILEGFLFRGMDGVGHLAHLGGLGTGFLGAMLLRARRDSETYSEVQAMRANLNNDWNSMSYAELETLMAAPVENVPLIMAFLRKAVTKPSAQSTCLETLRQYHRLLMEKADLQDLARIALWIPVQVGAMPPPFYLLLGSRLEGIGDYDTAYYLYRRVYDVNPQAPDTEMALFRLAHLLDQRSPDRSQAAGVYREMLRLFPDGPMAFAAKDVLRRLV